MTTGIRSFEVRNQFILAKVVYAATIGCLFSTRGDSHIKGMQVFIGPSCRGSKAVLVSLEVFSLKRSTAGAFAIAFK